MVRFLYRSEVPSSQRKLFVESEDKSGDDIVLKNHKLRQLKDKVLSSGCVVYDW